MKKNNKVIYALLIPALIFAVYFAVSGKINFKESFPAKNDYIKKILYKAPGKLPAIPQAGVDPLNEFKINDRVLPPSSGNIYADYITGKKKIDFNPTPALCLEILNHIKNEYVNEINIKILLRSAKKETGILLAAAGINRTKLVKIQLTENLFEEIMQNYSDAINGKLLMLACINGLVNGLGDLHCEFLSPSEYRDFLSRTREEHYSGIGVRISKDSTKSPVKIIDVFTDGTAYEAGIRKNDSIVKINGKSMKGLTLQEAAAKMTGKNGTPVEVTILKNGRESDISLKCREITVKTVTSCMLPDKIGYIKIDSFKEELAGEFHKSYASLEKQGLQALILDLRDNPGGLVTQAQSLCGFFLPRDSVIAEFRHRHNNKRIILSKGSRIVFVPVAVLVNEYSASSSEITAGALKDTATASIIGPQTRGKGSVQRTTPLTGGSAIKLTIEKIYSPGGFSIDKHGIVPDIKVEPDDGENDTVLETSIRHLKGITAKIYGKNPKKANLHIFSRSYKFALDEPRIPASFSQP